MKITRRQLRKIIKETYNDQKHQRHREPGRRNTASVTLPPPVIDNSKWETQEEYRARIAREEEERIDSEANLKESVGMHRCIDGRMVHPESEDCLFDINDRIDDAQHHRQSHSCGSENRIYYNGLLKGLRKQRNRLQKLLNL